MSISGTSAAPAYQSVKSTSVASRLRLPPNPRAFGRWGGDSDNGGVDIKA